MHLFNYYFLGKEIIKMCFDWHRNIKHGGFDHDWIPSQFEIQKKQQFTVISLVHYLFIIDRFIVEESAFSLFICHKQR